MDLLDVAPLALLVGIGLIAAGVWEFRVGRRTDRNHLRILGLLMVGFGLLVALPMAALLLLFYMWATSGMDWL